MQHSIDKPTIDPIEPVIIVIDPKRIVGTPCFIGTRVPVAVLLKNLADGLTIHQFISQYPSIRKDIAVEALRQANVVLNRAAILI